ncbi:hypothetical protein [Metasolibacillus meyeri]|uniref:hypothetical protein n=1 Tax=Metasolibacillus meyeri TaxID=1071052 RepID=UPI000D31D1C5|nr:hypothetical protein [Metasolibacillus meyeri]
MDYQVQLNNGQAIILENAEFEAKGSESVFNVRDVLSVHFGNYLTNKHLINAIIPDGAELIDLPFVLTLSNGTVIAKGTHAAIDLTELNKIINDPQALFFEFGGSLIIKHSFVSIMPNEVVSTLSND